MRGQSNELDIKVDDGAARVINAQANRNTLGIAEVYAFRGQSDKTMHWLARAYAQKDADLGSVKETCC